MNLSIYKGKSKKSGKEFECLKLTIGEWSQLVFPASKFEMRYIKEELRRQAHQDFKGDSLDVEE